MDPAAVLEDPSEFLGLAPLRASARRVRVWSAPAFGDPRSYTLYALERGFIVRRVTLVRAVHVDAPQPWGADGAADARAVRDLLAELRALRIPAFADDDGVGRDGDTHGVQTFGVERAARLTWWERPAGWEALCDWHARATTRFDTFLVNHRPGKGP